ncbi:CocE/NonD family hydrolase C-terminal non-catalytic domain-containing protein [Streptomyces sp. NPDC059627]
MRHQAPSKVTVPMSFTAYRFAAGHRIRWQISGGAHPRYARSPGTGKSSVDAEEFTPVRITLHTAAGSRGGRGPPCPGPRSRGSARGHGRWVARCTKAGGRFAHTVLERSNRSKRRASSAVS